MGDTDDGWLVDVARWSERRIRRFLGVLLGAVATLLANAAFFDRPDFSKSRGALAVIAAIASGYFIFAEDSMIAGAVGAKDDAVEAKETAELELQRLSSTVSECVQIATVEFYRRLSLGSDDRVSLFVYDGVDLNLISRYSENELLTVTGRDRYPADKGFLGVAWASGSVECLELPNPEVDLEAYCQAHVTHGLPETAARDLTMKSRCYVGTALWNASCMFKIGVVMVESLVPQRISASDLPNGADLLSLARLTLTQRTETIPSVDQAREEGF